MGAQLSPNGPSSSGTQDVNVVSSVEVEVKNDTGNALPVSNTYLSNQSGTWAYYAGTSGTVNVSAGQRVIGIAAHSTVGGSMTINGGASITIPANSGISIAPIGNITAPTIVFTSTDSYFIEVVS